MHTILITGGAGFIGSNLIRYFRQHHPDYRLIALDAFTRAGSIDNLKDIPESDHYSFWYGNTRNGELVDMLIEQSDFVIHLAAETYVTRSIFDNRLFFETDIIGTQAVANAVVRHNKTVKRFIHVSTSEVYGTSTEPSINEDHAINPVSPYASSKAGADRLVYSYWATYDIPAVMQRR